MIHYILKKLFKNKSWWWLLVIVVSGGCYRWSLVVVSVGSMRIRSSHWSEPRDWSRDVSSTYTGYTCISVYLTQGMSRSTNRWIGTLSTKASSFSSPELRLCKVWPMYSIFKQAEWIVSHPSDVSYEACHIRHNVSRNNCVIKNWNITRLAGTILPNLVFQYVMEETNCNRQKLMVVVGSKCQWLSLVVVAGGDCQRQLFVVVAGGDCQR